MPKEAWVWNWLRCLLFVPKRTSLSFHTNHKMVKLQLAIKIENLENLESIAPTAGMLCVAHRHTQNDPQTRDGTLR